MKIKYIVTIVISIIISLIILAYAAMIMIGLISTGFSRIGTLVVAFVAMSLLGMKIYTMIERLKEQKEENSDDYRKY